MLVWNQESQEIPWQRDIRALYQDYDKGTPQQYKGWWKSMYDTKAYTELFAPPEEHSIPWTVGLTEEQVGGLPPSLPPNPLLSLSFGSESGQDPAQH